MRLAVLGLVAMFSLGCGPVVSDEQQGDTGPMNRETSDGDSGEETGLGGTEGEVETTSGVETTSELDPLVGPESVHAEIRCNHGQEQSGPHLWMEAWLDGPVTPDCSPPPDVSLDWVLVWISEWDGESGTFIVGDEHPHRASLGLSDEIVEGTVSVEVDAPYALVSAHLDLHISTRSAVGDLDFSLCPPRLLDDPPCQ